MHGKVYAVGSRWLEIDPKTLRYEFLNKKTLPERYHFLSWHYGILAWETGGFRRVSVQEAPVSKKESSRGATAAEKASTHLEPLQPGKEEVPQKAAREMRGEPLPILGAMSAGNLLTGEKTDQPERRPLHAVPGDVIEIRLRNRWFWTYLFSGKEPRPLRFSGQRQDGYRVLLLHMPAGDEVVGIQASRPFSQQRLEELCAKYPHVRCFRVPHPLGKYITDLAPISRLSNLNSLDIAYAVHLRDLKPLSDVKNLASLRIVQWDRLESVEPLTELRKLRVLQVSCANRIRNLRPLGRIESLAMLSRCVDPVEDVSIGPLSGLKNLKRLLIGQCSWKNELEPLAGLVNLEHLVIQDASNVSSLEPLSTLVNLRELDVHNARPGISLAPLADLKRLERLAVSSTVTGLDAVSGLQNLTCLERGGCQDLAPLSTAKRLKELTVSCPNATDLRPLSGLKNLTKLYLHRCPKLRDITALAELTDLTYLNLECNSRIEDLTPLSDRTRLTFLSLSDCSRVSDLRPLSNMTDLNHLKLENCTLVSEIGELPGIGPLANMKKLRRLDIENCDRIGDLTPLAGLPNLAHLDVKRCHNVISLTQLGEMPSLRELYISWHSRLTVEEVQAFKKANPNCVVHRW